MKLRQHPLLRLSYLPLSSISYTSADPALNRTLSPTTIYPQNLPRYIRPEYESLLQPHTFTTYISGIAALFVFYLGCYLSARHIVFAYYPTFTTVDQDSTSCASLPQLLLSFVLILLPSLTLSPLAWPLNFSLLGFSRLARHVLYRIMHHPRIPASVASRPQRNHLRLPPFHHHHPR